MAERIICGFQAVGGLLRRQPERVITLYLDAKLGPGRRARLPDLDALGIRVENMSVEGLDGLSGQVKHQGIAARVSGGELLGEAQAKDLVLGLSEPLLLLLDGVEDPRNFGACLRSADAAGADLVVVGRSRNVGLTPAVSKVAAGAAEILPVAAVPNLARFMAWLSSQGIALVGTDDEAGAGLYATDLRGPLGLVMGAEGKGLRRLTRERCDQLVSLPMQGSVESLNVSVATGVCLYEALRQRSPGC